jgi:HAD superfamily hydrolase (TIGR01509 family)
MIRAVVFDLDGVVRHFRPIDGIAAEHGLTADQLLAVAFRTVGPALVGAATFEDWIDQIGAALARDHGEPARGAAARFATVPSDVDPAVVALARRLRATCTTAILTNGTTRVEQEVEDLRVDGAFDHLFNTARIGHAKPDPRAFRHVLDALAIRADECAFTDDTEAKLAGAIELGIHNHHFTGIDALIAWLRTLGVDC